MTTLNVVQKCEKEHPEGSNPDQIQTLFGSFLVSGCQPGPGWAPGPHFHRFGCPKTQKSQKNKQKLDSNMCIFMYFFYGESFLRRLVFCVGLLVTVLTPLHVWPLTPLFVPTRACGPRPKRRAAAPQRGRGVQPGGLQCIAGGAAMTRRRRLQ